MTSNDRAEFVRVLNGLAAIKRVDLTEEAYAMWWNAMRDWTIEQFREAAGHLLKSCQFMPSPYDFEQLKKASDPGPSEAWERAMVHAEGAWRQGLLGEPLIDRAVRAIGGYSTIALCPKDKLGFQERRFREAYSEMRDSTETREALPHITGEARIRNGGPVQIGEAIKKAI